MWPLRRNLIFFIPVLQTRELCLANSKKQNRMVGYQQSKRMLVIGYRCSVLLPASSFVIISQIPWHVKNTSWDGPTHISGSAAQHLPGKHKIAKLLFSDGEKVIPRLAHELPGIKRGRLAEEECAHRGSPIPKKRKGRPPGHMLSSERAAAGMVRWKPKSCEPIRREGPKWDPARLNEATTFVLGSRANKALGMGGTRGRIYIKHPHLFKYAADPQDKHWLAENHHMRATGGKMAYLLIEEDIRDLAASDDYRGCLDLKLDELKSFVLPSWIVEKMRKYMETLRTENEHHSAEAPGQT
ncbi:deoxynucleotidyltransferase terminal-interacting protein 1 isoform X6 [Cavia porcellus]|uniref:deoxynucleotidyltransferase terminal-interacting protein 1 isoform X6 n=1 Tax=Cavia porcellus TaxID=10141 RepID=UPI002FE19E65